MPVNILRLISSTIPIKEWSKILFVSFQQWLYRKFTNIPCKANFFKLSWKVVSFISLISKLSSLDLDIKFVTWKISMWYLNFLRSLDAFFCVSSCIFYYLIGSDRSGASFVNLRAQEPCEPRGKPCGPLVQMLRIFICCKCVHWYSHENKHKGNGTRWIRPQLHV